MDLPIVLYRIVQLGPHTSRIGPLANYATAITSLFRFEASTRRVAVNAETQPKRRFKPTYVRDTCRAAADYFLLLTTMLFSKDWNPDGLVSSNLAYSEGFSYSYLQHCYVTGGSTGLGLELAKLLTQMGAHVSIVARNQERLDAALSQLEVYSRESIRHM
jgi:hypothetical protein